ncbi:unnamed protein product [Brassicogethes aeneus]|uniref:CCHC-type domain-containing protein n=1 Tax=Brassicogethes aeneus TaxID=1431903 RepID=A0A9P0FKA3_BRAAE|nr:unnamed protein product [Brassicogethes aeneus]
MLEEHSRRRSIARTPPKEIRARLTPETTSFPEDKNEYGKRGRGGKENPEQMHKEMTYLEKLIAQTCQGIDEIYKQTVEITNTKTETKCAPRKLNDLATKLKSIRVNNFMKAIQEDLSQKCPRLSSEDTIRHTSSGTQPHSRTIGTQTEEEIGTQEETEAYNAMEIRELIEGTNAGDAMKVFKVPWLEEAYKNTKIMEGNPLGAPKEFDQAVFPLESEITLLKRILRQGKDKYPELLELENEETYITRTVQTSKEKTTNFIYMIRVKGQEEGDIISSVQSLAKTMTENERTKVAIPRISNIEVNKLRKMIEIAEGRNEEESTLFVKDDKKTYAELLKDIREEIKSDPNLKIKTIRETKKGELMVTMNKQDHNFETLKQKIKEKMGDDCVRAKRADKNRKVIHIKGMDALTTEEEIMEALDDRAGEGKEIEITSLRPAYGNTKIATIRTREAISKILLETGKIYIGVSNCEMYLRKEIRRCYRCWDHNHIARECQGQDRKGNNALKKEFLDLKAEIQNKVLILKEKNTELQNENKALKQKILSIERKQKKYNLLAYGVKGNEEENTLQIQCDIKDFRDINRIGKASKNQPRPVAIEVVNNNLKYNILKKSAENKELKANNSIEYTQEDYEERKKLYKYLKSARENKLNAKIKRNRLVLDSGEYSANDLENNPDLLNLEKSSDLQSNDQEDGDRKRKSEDSPSKETLAIPKKNQKQEKIIRVVLISKIT